MPEPGPWEVVSQRGQALPQPHSNSLTHATASSNGPPHRLRRMAFLPCLRPSAQASLPTRISFRLLTAHNSSWFPAFQTVKSQHLTRGA